MPRDLLNTGVPQTCNFFENTVSAECDKRGSACAREVLWARLLPSTATVVGESAPAASQDMRASLPRPPGAPCALRVS